ncbi:MAG TPA: DUF2600 family protein [Solirubrobacteraceae bacterium]|nr:DUF2600 family protein [Solirubrobacteraceae bacterium]
MYPPRPSAPPTEIYTDRGKIGKHACSDTAPLTARQLQALAVAAARQLGWGLLWVARETRSWHRRARLIPDTALRDDALSALLCKRGNIDGAALFWTLPRDRDFDLLRLLVAHQVMWDFLDDADEHGANAGTTNGRQLYLALVDALDWPGGLRDYYHLHPWREDAGYLRTLTETCRELCGRMPSYTSVRELLLRDARRAGVQTINHDLDPDRRSAALRSWVLSERQADPDTSWFEFAGASSAVLSRYALLALSAQSSCANSELDQVYGVYFPWVSVAGTMLDSYVDEAEDIAKGGHAYLAYYPDWATAISGMTRLVRRSFEETDGLPHAERHRVIVACAVALYLSHDAARTVARRPTSRRLAQAGGSLTRLLVPVLRLWRVVYSQRST